MSDLERRIVEQIRADGPMRFDAYLERALYDPDGGFYAQASGAGRRRDFLTSPEVGPLFGAVLARAVDTWWEDAGRPDEWTVIDAGAGPATLLRSIVAAGPTCGAQLRPLAVDRSASQRSRHVDGFESMAALPDGPITGVILANELLDNLPWRLLESSTGGADSGSDWVDVRVGAAESGELVEVLDDEPVTITGPANETIAKPEPGARLPLQQQAAAWLDDVLHRLARGRCVVIDYASTTAAMSDRPWSDWTRTYRSHERGGHPLDQPGRQDITCEVAVDQLAAVREPDSQRSQAEFLRTHGIDDLVEDGRRVWNERAHIGDLEALEARSRISEAEALTDLSGLGAFTVLQWSV